MRFQVFQYTFPVPAELEDLNAFLAKERVASVTHHVVSTASGGLLVFVVQTPLKGGGGSSSVKIDYREVLEPQEFAVFNRLRDERKLWAEADGVPVYTVFTNAQLAEMVKRSPLTEADLGAIEGIGPARIKKYGERIMAILTGSSPGEKGDEEVS